MSGRWTLDSTMEYLNEYPLPADFKWPHRDGGLRVAWPVHRVFTGYGKWLRETPYYQGLFERCHRICEKAEQIGDGVWLAGEIAKTLEQEKKDLFS
jgi:hypothetical protein